ncbi:unnamed protein product, partial [Medioppia subpectinata]
EPNHNSLQIEVFVTVLLNLASKSFTHCFSAIAKYHSAFMALKTSEEAQISILSTIFEVWRKHQQLLVILISKLLKSEVIECSSVANWLFSKENSSEFMKSYIWEILNQTIQKSIRSVESLEKELEESKEKLRKKCESQGKSFKSHWFRWTIGRLQQVFFEHHNHVFKYLSTFETLLFTADLDQHILLIFKQFCALRN